MKSKKSIVAAMLGMALISLFGTIYMNSKTSQSQVLLAENDKDTNPVAEETETAGVSAIDIADMVTLNSDRVLLGLSAQSDSNESSQNLMIQDNTISLGDEDVTQEGQLLTTDDESTAASGNMDDTNSESASVMNSENTDDTNSENAAVMNSDSADALNAENEKTAESEGKTLTVASTLFTVISISEDEYYNLCKIVEAEAGGTDRKGRILVADVVINRVKSSHFPNSVNDVIFSPGQFMPVSTGSFYSMSISSLTEEAVSAALYGEDYSQGALYFSSVKSSEAGNWQSRSLTRLFEYAGNVFYAGY